MVTCTADPKGHVLEACEGESPDAACSHSCSEWQESSRPQGTEAEKGIGGGETESSQCL